MHIVYFLSCSTDISEYIAQDAHFIIYNSKPGIVTVFLRLADKRNSMAIEKKSSQTSTEVQAYNR